MYKKLSSFATFLSFWSPNFFSVSYQIILFEMETMELMYGLEALSILETVAMCLWMIDEVSLYLHSIKGKVILELSVNSSTNLRVVSHTWIGVLGTSFRPRCLTMSSALTVSRTPRNMERFVNESYFFINRHAFRWAGVSLRSPCSKSSLALEWSSLDMPTCKSTSTQPMLQIVFFRDDCNNGATTFLFYGWEHFQTDRPPIKVKFSVSKHLFLPEAS